MRLVVLKACFYPPKAYFELIRSADVCVILTDIIYAKQKMTVRTPLRNDNRLTVPVRRPNKRRQPGGTTQLCKITVMPFDTWLPQQVARLSHLYGDLQGHQVFEDFKKLNQHSDNLAHFLYRCTRSILRYYNIHTPLTDSREYPVHGLQGQDRVIELCGRIGANEYMTLEGVGCHYDPIAFQRKGIRLKYLTAEPKWSTLSILDDAFSWWLAS